MLKDFSWNTFKKTGVISAYCLYKELQNVSCEASEAIEVDLVELGLKDGVCEVEGYSNGR